MTSRTLSTMIMVFLFMIAGAVKAEELDKIDCSLPGDSTRTEKLKGRVPAQEERFRQSYVEAECLRRAAATRGFEWLETQDLLLRSKGEADGGHWENALALVERARLQAEQALHQAEHEAEAWKKRVVD